MWYLLFFVYYLYNYYMVCALLSHTHHVTMWLSIYVTITLVIWHFPIFLMCSISWLGKMAKSLFIFLFLFLFLLSWIYYIEGSVGKCHSHITGSHSVTSHDRSHDRHGKVVHRPYSSCISSIQKITGITNSHLLFVMGALIF